MNSLTAAHLITDEGLHAGSVDDSDSGTTAVSVFFSQAGPFFCTNLGDSRAVIASESCSKQGAKYVVKPLSKDQTFFRKDERARCRGMGGEVMTIGQLQGEEPMHDDFDVDLGNQIDEGGDPPRLWEPNGLQPGCAFSRSIGDRGAKKYGCVADPEIDQFVLKPEDRMLVLASDGVWEFYTNQARRAFCSVVRKRSETPTPAQNVVDIIHSHMRYGASMETLVQGLCDVVARSYSTWISREVRCRRNASAQNRI